MADEPNKDPNDPNQRLTREEAMAVVRASAAARRAAQDIGDKPEPAPAQASDPEVDLDPAKQLEKQTDPPVVLGDNDLGHYKVKVKVNGEERVVTIDELRSSAQKNDAADVYLREAKEKAAQIMDGARAEAAALKAAATPPAPAAPAAPAPKAEAEALPAQVDAAIDAAVDKLFVGDMDDTKRLFKEAFAQTRPVAPPTPPPPPPALDADQIAAQVERKVVVRSALRHFAKEYPTIVNDPIARTVADQFLTEATEGKPLEAFPEEKIGAILASTGERFKEWTRSHSGVPANAVTATTRDAKQNAKESIDELPATATRAAVVAPPSKTTSDIIRDMKAHRERGQLREPPQP